jgi:hypothetical protein
MNMNNGQNQKNVSDLLRAFGCSIIRSNVQKADPHFNFLFVRLDEAYAVVKDLVNLFQFACSFGLVLIKFCKKIKCKNILKKCSKN